MPNPTEQSNPALDTILSLQELAELLVKHKGLHEGLYNLAVQFQFAIGAVGPSPEAVVPGVMFGVSGVGLEKVDQPGPHTVDAAVVNPAPNKSIKKSPTKLAKSRVRSS